MLEYYPTISKILLGVEFLAALIGLLYLLRFKKTYWNWFSIYLIFIFIQECFWFFNSSFFSIIKQEYYAFLGIPVQYLFMYWLFAFKSLKNKKLFVISVCVYVSTFFFFKFFYKDFKVVYSLNLTVGTILLMILIILEFLKQIKSDNILKFKENKMFYISAGVVLFYIGTYPFFTFNRELAKEYVKIWNMYYLYSLLANCGMYLLFIFSFIWGKRPLK